MNEPFTAAAEYVHQLDVLKPGGRYAWKERAIAADAALAEERRLRVQAEQARDEAIAVLTDIVATLQREAPGTPLNNHRFDALGIRANNIINRSSAQPPRVPGEKGGQ